MYDLVFPQATGMTEWLVTALWPLPTVYALMSVHFQLITE
jgi:hypothetical protein